VDVKFEPLYLGLRESTFMTLLHLLNSPVIDIPRFYHTLQLLRLLDRP
jgi:hypothetical protein